MMSLEQTNPQLTRQQLDEKVSRELMAGMDGDLSAVSDEALDVLSSLGGDFFRNTPAVQQDPPCADEPFAAQPACSAEELTAQQDPLDPTQDASLQEDIMDHSSVIEEESEYLSLQQCVEYTAAEDEFVPHELLPQADAQQQSDSQTLWQPILHTTLIQRTFLCAMVLLMVFSIAKLSSRFIGESRLLSCDVVYGVVLEDTSVEGMTAEALADTAAQILAQKDTSQSITLLADDTRYTTTLDAFSPIFDAEAACDRAWEVGRTGDRTDRLFAIYTARCLPQKIGIPFRFDEAAVDAYVAELAEKIDRPVQDASLTFDPSIRDGSYPFVEVAESAGRTLDREAAEKIIAECASSGQTQAELPVNTQEPAVYLADLKENAQLMRTFTTEYARSNTRGYNIRRATDSINGTVLQPGDEFSFNRIVGNTSLPQNGYREAGVIVGGRSATDLGGGVCQAATTLYNVAVRCDMQITARDPHAIASTYVPRGHDATIAYGYYDMAFINTSEYPVYIIGSHTETSVTFTMYGRPLDDGVTIELESELLGVRYPGSAKVTVDPNKPTGYTETIVSALNGYDVRTYKVWFDANNNEIRRIVDHTDAYPTRRAEIITGGMEPAAPSPAPNAGGESTGSTPDPIPDTGGEST